MHKTTLTRRDAVKLVKLIQDANNILVNAIEKDGSTHKPAANAHNIDELVTVSEVLKSLLYSVGVK